MGVRETSDSKISTRTLGQPDILKLIASTSLLLGEELRNEFVQITDLIGSSLRDSILKGNNVHPDIKINMVSPLSWSSLRGEVVCFIDGGVGEVDILTKRPLILRSGIFKIITGERDLEAREDFLTFPIFVGDIKKGLKTSNDFSNILRIIIECLSAYRVSIDPRYKDVEYLLVHGPILYHMSAYSGHFVGAEDIINIWDTSGGQDSGLTAHQLLENYSKFVGENRDNPEWYYMNGDPELIRMPGFTEYLMHEIVNAPNGLKLTGVVERGPQTEYLRDYIVPILRDVAPDLLEQIVGDISRMSTSAISEKLIQTSNYNDALIHSLTLEPKEYTSPVATEQRYSGFKNDLTGFGTVLASSVPISYSFLKVRNNSIPVRVETITTQNDYHEEIMSRVYMYSTLLPQYAFPIGLDIVDKYAKVPDWMMHTLKMLVTIKMGEQADDVEKIEGLRKMLSQILISKRDFYYRPDA